ncbi:hypothetical protein [Falsiroseomonas oryziterrae]|uniref:hypothetical protein n=1 Tax=Falsiroseomonas oryziterrae TaxID=2911368 RepID=UPI001F271D7F|nr:hypothetical protein [Roseomonas sp. NPKOSM-4]
MGSWVALVLVALAGGTALETRYFDSRAACEDWASRITTPSAALRPDAGHQVAGCFHVRELISQLAQGR